MTRLGRITIGDITIGRVICLKLRRGGERFMLPEANLLLEEGDELLFWGRKEARQAMLTLMKHK